MYSDKGEQNSDEAFEIITPLGQGAFATTYLARVVNDALLAKWGLDREGDNDQVALKVPSGQQAEMTITNEFANTAALLRRIQKKTPNIVKLIDLWKYKNRLSLIFEFARGGNLRERISHFKAKHRPFPLDEALRITDEVLAGIGIIHAENIVHHDIKPENILFRQDGTAMVADFGLAKTLTPDERADGASGTVHYLAPEVLHRGNMNYLIDIWAVGVMLYEMVTGRTPFGGSWTPPYDVMDAIMTKEPQLPHDLRPDCPSEIQCIINYALRKEPDGRFANAHEMRRHIALFCWRASASEQNLISTPVSMPDNGAVEEKRSEETRPIPPVPGNAVTHGKMEGQHEEIAWGTPEGSEGVAQSRKPDDQSPGNSKAAPAPAPGTPSPESPLVQPHMRDRMSGIRRDQIPANGAFVSPDEPGAPADLEPVVAPPQSKTLPGAIFQTGERQPRSEDAPPVSSDFQQSPVDHDLSENRDATEKKHRRGASLPVNVGGLFKIPGSS